MKFLKGIWSFLRNVILVISFFGVVLAGLAGVVYLFHFNEPILIETFSKEFLITIGVYIFLAFHVGIRIKGY